MRAPTVAVSIASAAASADRVVAAVERAAASAESARASIDIAAATLAQIELVPGSSTCQPNVS